LTGWMREISISGQKGGCWEQVKREKLATVVRYAKALITGDQVGRKGGGTEE